uniref:Calpain 8 [Rattus norvegicus] n=2 Tax=Lepeophtheirus salmonis TaxID=72036 RepID=A0A0K2SXN3_LEPSM
MAYGDFLKYFKTLDICHISHNIDTSASFRGRWEADHNAGGVLKGDFRNYACNPQCFIQLDDPDYKDPLARCSAIISLMQKRKAHSRAKGMNKIGFKVYKVEDEVEELSRDFFFLRRNDKSHKKVAKTPTWHDGRETNIRVRLPPGKYCIIPSTYEPEVEGDFILRVHFEKYSREGDAEYSHQTLDYEEGEDEVDEHSKLIE